MPKKQPDLHKIADSYVKRFADTFEQSANALPARITMGAVEKDMARGIRAHPKSLYAIIDEVPIIKAPQTQAEQKAQKVYESIIQQVAATQGVVMDLDSPFVLEAAKKLTADLVTNVSKETKAAIRQMIFEAIRDGDPPVVAQKYIRTIVGLTKRDAITVKRMMALHPDRVDRLRNKLIRRRAINIARTESMRAANLGQKATWQQMIADDMLDPATTRTVWICSLDDRLCPDCAAMEGETTEIDGTFTQTERGVLPSERVPYDGPTVESPPLHPSCVIGGTIVQSPNIERVYRRLYVGPVLKIRLATGEVCTVTPNHPVLTDSGWKAAGALDKGDRLVYSGLTEQLANPIYPDVESAPAEVSEVYDAATVAGVKHRVRGMGHQFHGDGFDGEVDVVTIDGQLRDGVEAASAEHDFEQVFAPADSALGLASVTSGFDHRLVGVTGGSERGAFLGGGPVHADVHGLTPVARLDPGFDEASADDIAADGERIRDGLLGLSSLVSLHEFIDIQVVAFHGFVYNLQTADGWYWSNGIVSHNCRCTTALEFDD